AEDGIRDGHVTGVQTCALPIYIAHDRRCVWPSHSPLWNSISYRCRAHENRRRPDPSEHIMDMPVNSFKRAIASGSIPYGAWLVRSEERRVGKGWGRRGGEDVRE